MSDRVRSHLARALQADLVGPYDLDRPEAEEILELPPTRWYLTGFLAPQALRERAEPPDDPSDEEDLGAGPDDDDEETGAQETQPKQRAFFPASMGLSVLLPAGPSSDVVQVTFRYADYVKETQPEEGRRRGRTVWRRVARPEATASLRLDPAALAKGAPLEGTDGLRVVGKLGTGEGPGLPKGTRALSLFVVNEREVEGARPFDHRFVFQTSLELRFEGGILPRANRAGERSRDWDDRVADLQFRAAHEHAVGHGVAIEAPARDADGTVRAVRTTWIPRHEVRRVVTSEEKSPELAAKVETRMEELATLADGATAACVLTPLCDAYAAWIVGQRGRTDRIDSDPRRETRDGLMAAAERARARIEQGISALADEDVRSAFQIANRAMADQARRRKPKAYEKDVPRWRLFQLAFVLMNLPSIAEGAHADRDNVELIFFPTGGGKTEAYLGVIAFALALRRLRGRSRPDKGLGVAVLLRYTLRLLTLDQLDRAATLVCALELLRRADPDRLGHERFAVGLWVGRSATANTLAVAAREIEACKVGNGPWPYPLVDCPWCRAPLDPQSLRVKGTKAKPEAVVVSCRNWRDGCPFAEREEARGLPVLYVDEQLYDELPAFVVATVDKLAMVPWRGETGKLFGHVTAKSGPRFLGALDKAVPGAEKLPAGLLPPELIVQDELHLISGPLGTMVGLFETAVESFCTRRDGANIVRPKIIASTATVRRAKEQVRALFARTEDRTVLFPPPGVDPSETFFATVDRESPGRLYAGVAAPGRSMKAILLRTYLALLTAAQRAWDPKGAPDQTADAYMTLAGYFNSLRELGGMRRLVEDDVRTRARQASDRKPANAEKAPHSWSADRSIEREPVELTSRESSARIKDAKDRLAKPHTDERHVDVLLASNMISVGVDIDRLGMMVVAGQPKTTSEYIQASSRVGRQTRWPGLVVTCFNVVKPRDRSHYERFAAYHESFYRFVEAQSLTPFSGPALDRGLAALLIGMARHAHADLTPATGAMEIDRRRPIADAQVNLVSARGGEQSADDKHRSDALVAELAARGRAIVDEWITLVMRARQEGGSKRAYSPFDRAREAGNPIMFTALEEQELERLGGFRAPTSMRDVEPSAHLWVERRELGGKRDGR